MPKRKKERGKVGEEIKKRRSHFSVKWKRTSALLKLPLGSVPGEPKKKKQNGDRLRERRGMVCSSTERENCTT